MAVINSPIEAHPIDIASAFSQKGLSGKQQRVLEELPSFGSAAVFNKRDVSMLDLSAMTAATGDEFTMFTLKNERLIVRGDSVGVPLRPHELSRLDMQGYRWSGHTHPGTTLAHLNVSKGDVEVLKCFRQKRSSVYNAAGRCAVYDASGGFDVIERR